MVRREMVSSPQTSPTSPFIIPTLNKIVITAPTNTSQQVVQPLPVVSNSIKNTEEVFFELCYLNSLVGKQRIDVKKQLEEFNSLVILILHPLDNTDEFIKISNNIDACCDDINQQFNNLNIENNEDVKTINDLIQNIAAITSEYDNNINLLNNYLESLKEKINLLNEFKNKYFTILDEMEVSKYLGDFSNIKFPIELDENYENNATASLNLIEGQLENINNLLKTFQMFSNNNEFSLILQQGLDNLKKENVYLHETSKNLITTSTKCKIMNSFKYYEMKMNDCERLINVAIPFIKEKHDQLQTIPYIIKNYSSLSQRLKELEMGKDLLIEKISSKNKKLNCYNLMIKNNQEKIAKYEPKINKYNNKVQDLKAKLKKKLNEMNEIKLNFLQLKKIGFKLHNLCDDIIFMNIQEMSKEIFEIERIIENTNHKITIGRLNNKLYIIKEYIKDGNTFEKLQKELKITKKLEHLNIIKIEGIYIKKKSKVCVVMPYYPISSFAARFYCVNVTLDYQNIMQEIINCSCNSLTLGSGIYHSSNRQTYSKMVVTNVYRIENYPLFNLFNSKMVQLESYNDPPNIVQVQTEKSDRLSKSYEWMKTVGLNQNVNEKYLWHGTEPEIIKSIIEHGFDERVANMNSWYGAGIYFADYCSKSDQYCTPDTSGEYTLLLCRVMLGRCIDVRHHPMKQQRRPNEMENSNGRVFDSVLGKSNEDENILDFDREFVVYDKSQCYPEFIIKYKRQENHLND